MPRFFIPHIDADKQEAAYAELAQMVGTVTANLERRVYSIVWTHDNVEWTATVGEQLRGIATIVQGRGRDKRERRVPRSTDDTVLAIFEGVPFLIAHDNKSRIWNVPILAGEPITVVRFD